MKKGGEIMPETGEGGYKPSEKTKIVAEYLKKTKGCAKRNNSSGSSESSN